MPKPAITDFATILTKENMEPLFDLAWGALKVATEDAVAKTPEEARDALELYSSDEVDALISAFGAMSYETALATAEQTVWQLSSAPTFELSVYVNGVHLTRDVDYTVADDTVIFTLPLAENDRVSAQYR